MTRTLAALALGWLLAVGQAWGSGISIMRGQDGTTGTVYDFGGVKLYNDSRGTTGTVYDFGTIQQYRFSGPSGDLNSGTIYRFDSPRIGPTIPPLAPPVAPLFPMIPYGGGVAPGSNPGGSQWRGGTSR
ncbi:MAG: hypothetical protein AB1411_12450 [Nitrospirota bacterium]